MTIRELIASILDGKEIQEWHREGEQWIDLPLIALKHRSILELKTFTEVKTLRLKPLDLKDLERQMVELQSKLDDLNKVK